MKLNKRGNIEVDEDGMTSLDVGHFADPIWNKVAGYKLIACALGAWYMMARIILNNLFGREVLPAGKAWL